MALKCPTCDSRGYVKDTRTRKDNVLNRRYRCSKKSCKTNWSTTEIIVYVDTDGKPLAGRRQLKTVLSETIRKEVQVDMRRNLKALFGMS